jgi:hypothetical protein
MITAFYIIALFYLPNTLFNLLKNALAVKHFFVKIVNFLENYPSLPYKCPF